MSKSKRKLKSTMLDSVIDLILKITPLLKLAGQLDGCSVRVLVAVLLWAAIVDVLGRLRSGS